MNTHHPSPTTHHPIYLGFDTATPFLSLALWNEEQGTLAAFAENIGRDHAKRIIVEIDNLFKIANVSPSQLVGMGVGVGPGSYTGVRVGIATAKALAKGLNVSLVGVNTLSAMAFAALTKNEQGIVALDARKGSVYAGIFEKRNEGVLELFPVQKVDSSLIQKQHPSLRYIQDVCPNASYIAQAAPLGKDARVEGIYL
jgi:tRNA threonylcarbamoyladenosine biosynthesis protein TsaB